MRTALRVAKSLVRRRVPALREPVVPFDQGRSRMFADLTTSTGLRLYRYGCEEPDLALVRALLGPGDVFVDGGANVGFFTLVAAARVGARGKVIAFEPAPATRRMLEQNVKLSGFSCVDVRAEALTFDVGERTFQVLAGDGAGLSSFAPDVNVAAAAAAQLVRTTTLDAALSEEDRTRVAFVKLDLEGAEYAALKGAERLIDAVAPDLLLELEPAHLARQDATVEEVLGFLRERGYAFFRASFEPDGSTALRPTELVEASANPNFFATKRPERLERALPGVFRA